MFTTGFIDWGNLCSMSTSWILEYVYLYLYTPMPSLSLSLFVLHFWPRRNLLDAYAIHALNLCTGGTATCFSSRIHLNASETLEKMKATCPAVLWLHQTYRCFVKKNQWGMTYIIWDSILYMYTCWKVLRIVLTASLPFLNHLYKTTMKENQSSGQWLIN